MPELTIDELARSVGMTVRTVRSHQTRGLLHGPRMRGRVGYYGDDHVERLQLIQELQGEGLPLRLVERLLTRHQETTGRMLELRRTVLGAFQTPEPITVTVDDLRGRFGHFDEEDFELARTIGAVSLQFDGSILVSDPGLLDIAEVVMSYGISLRAALRVGVQVQEACREVARGFVDLVRDEVWEPFDLAGRPEAQWPTIASTIEQIRPVASQVIVQMLPAAIAAEVERAFGEELREQAQSG